MKLKIFIVTMIAAEIVFCAIPEKTAVSAQKSLAPNAYEQSLYEQLSGQKKNAKSVVQKKTENASSNKIVASADKALMLARQSRNDKNYIMAIKRYNFILKYYSKTSQAKLALIDKASMYKEMGLQEQSKYNQRKVSEMVQQSKTKVIKR